MTMNFRKIWGFLFLAAMTVVSVPNAAWGQKYTLDSPSTFMEKKGVKAWAKYLKNWEEGKEQDLLICGDDVCDKNTHKCFVCRITLGQSNNEVIDTMLNLIRGPLAHFNANLDKPFCYPKTTSASQMQSYVIEMVRKKLSLSDKLGTDGSRYSTDTGNWWYNTVNTVANTAMDVYDGYLEIADDVKDAVGQNITKFSCLESSESVMYDGKAFVSLNVAGTDVASVDVATQEACRPGSDGKMYCLQLDGDNVSVVYGNSKGGFKGCTVLPIKLYEQRKCFFCPLFKVLFSAAENMSSISFNKLGAAFKSLIGIGLALWIAVQTLTHVSSLTKQDAPKFLGGLIKQSFKFLIAFLLLANSAQIYRYFVVPVLDAGLAFGGTLVSHNLGNSDVEIKKLSGIVDVGGVQYLRSSNGQSLYVSLATFIAKVQYAIAHMQAVGSSLICVGGHGMLDITNDVDFGDGFQMFIIGVLLAGFGLLLSLAFAFYLIDAVVQIGIIGALMPFLIACWPFKITSSYTGKGVGILLNSFFVFVFLGLVITVNIELISAALANAATAMNVDASSEDADTQYAAQELGGLYAIYDAINEQNLDKLTRFTDISGIGFLILVACCLFGFKLSGKAEELAGKMSGGAISGIGSSIGTMATSAAKGAALKTTAPLRTAAWNKTKDLGSKGWRAIKSGTRNVFRGKGGTKPSSGSSGGTGASSPSVGGSSGSSAPAVGGGRGSGGTASASSTVGGSRSSAANAGKRSKRHSSTTEAQKASRRNHYQQQLNKGGKKGVKGSSQSRKNSLKKKKSKRRQQKQSRRNNRKK